MLACLLSIPMLRDCSDMNRIANVISITVTLVIRSVAGQVTIVFLVYRGNRRPWSAGLVVVLPRRNLSDDVVLCVLSCVLNYGVAIQCPFEWLGDGFRPTV